MKGAQVKTKNKQSEWIKTYVEEIIDELRPFGDVLEVGYGQGIASNYIQKKEPKTHTIIENDPESVKQAKKWAEKQKNVKIIEGNWEEILPKLKIFDSIFFNDYTAK